MPTRPLKTLALLVCAALSALAQAQETDPPARVGRLAVTQGQVSVAPEFGADPAAAQVNWPVTTGNLITTAPGARTEVRVGSTSIRLDGDSSLEVIELDDANVRVRLHYGSASVRALRPETLPGFVLETPQVRVRLEQPGRVRVDAERVRDTSAVNVFEGTALVEGNGTQLTVRAGRRAEIGDDDVRTLAAVRDPFDDWAYQRDRYEDSAATSVRYVGSEMTGYEDLDRYGRWGDDSDYGPLWYPSVATTWVPYRDGSWAWVEPWGWTWVDNAPWGYAPFHYGRWVRVHERWAWAPGRHVERPVWAPALVGWVGGSNWSVAFHDRQRHPALGWYPLAPWDRYQPAYRAPESHLRWWNGAVREDRRPHDYRPQGLTVVPQDRFNHPGRVNVPRAPIATVPPVLVHNLPAAAPPVPVTRPGFGNGPRRDGQPGRVIGNLPPGAMPGVAQPANVGPLAGQPGAGQPGRPEPGRWERGRNDRNDRDGRDGRLDTGRVGRDGFVRQGPQPAGAPPVLAAGQAVQMNQIPPGQVAPATPVQPLPVTSPTPHQPPGALPVTSPTPHQGVQPPMGQPGQPGGWQGRERDGRDGRDNRENRENRENRDPGEWRRNRQQQAPQFAQPVAQSAQPVQQAQPMQPAQAAQPVVPHHGGWERREQAPSYQREAAPAVSARPMPQPVPQPQPAPQPQPVREAMREMPRPMPQPAPMAMPQPQPAPAGRPAENRGGDNHGRGEPRNPRDHDR